MRIMTVDGHCDTVLKIFDENSLFDSKNMTHVDIKRMLGKVDLQFFAVYIESDYKPYKTLQRCLHIIDLFEKEINRSRKFIDLVTSKEHLRKLGMSKKTHGILAIEGGEVLCGDIRILNILFTLGVRSICLTWNQRNEIADGCWESGTGGGLTSFGIKVVNRMNELGMIIDVSHMSEAGFWSVIDTSQAPIIVSHGNCKTICNHARNLNDNQIKALAQKEGVVGITFVPEFLTASSASIEDVLNHIEYVINLVGPDYVGIGSDFDGVDKLPIGLEEVSKIPDIAEGLFKRGYKEQDVRKIMGGNFLRILNRVLPDN